MAGSGKGAPTPPPHTRLEVIWPLLWGDEKCELLLIVACALHHKGLPGKASARGTCVSWWALPVLLSPHLSDINFPELLQPYVTAPAPPAAFFGGKVLIHPAHRYCSTALVAALRLGSTSLEQSEGEVKRGEKVGFGGRSHCSTCVSTSPLEMLARKRQTWWMVVFSRECNAKQVVPGT